MITIRIPTYEGGELPSEIDLAFEAHLKMKLLGRWPTNKFEVLWEGQRVILNWDGVAVAGAEVVDLEDVYRYVCDLWVEFLMSTQGEDVSEVQESDD